MKADIRRSRSAAVTVSALLLLLLLATTAAAQDPARPGLISADRLRETLGEPELVVLHVGEAEEFGREHIPGARLITLDRVSPPSGEGDDALRLQMAPEPAIRAALEELGVSDDSRVVVYHAGGSVTPATRVVFALDFAGLGSRTSLLDGGLAAWKRAGGGVTAALEAPARGTLTPQAARDVIVEAEWVRDRLRTPGITVVDARAPEFYDGTREAGPRLGHIAGAVNVPFSDLTDGDLRWLDTAALRARFEAAGVKPGDTVVAYCHIGQQATAVAFAARLLGYDVKLYDGSFQEWSRRPELPVEIRR